MTATSWATPMRTIPMGPKSHLDYGFDLTNAVDEQGRPIPWLAEGETIAAASWVIAGVSDDDGKTWDAWTEADGLAIDDTDTGSTVTKVWLSGGTAGKTYLVTCHVTTTEGREDDRSLAIRVVQR